jgi:hypothetical protein
MALTVQQASHGFEALLVDIFDDGVLPESGISQARHEPFVVALGRLPVVDDLKAPRGLDRAPGTGGLPNVP